MKKKGDGFWLQWGRKYEIEDGDMKKVMPSGVIEEMPDRPFYKKVPRS